MPVKQEYSLAHLTMLGCAPPEMIYIAARAGYDYVSLRPMPMRLGGEPDYSFAANPTLLAQTKAALKSTGMRVHDIELARIYDGLDVDSYCPEIEIGAELGARAVLCSIWTDDRSQYVEKFAQLCDLAARHSMTVDLEFVPISSVRTLAGVVDVLRAVGRANAGIMIDIHHFHRSRDDPRDLDALPGEWFRFIHMNDAIGQIPTQRDEMVRIIREGRLYPGEGGIDVASILAHLPLVVHSIELPNSAYVRERGYAEHAHRCLEATRSYLARHPEAYGRAGRVPRL